MESFQHGILACQSPDSSFFSEFRELLRSMHDLWDTLPASKIIVSACDFVNGCLMEQTPAIMNMSIPNTAISWPYYLRNKTGSAAAFYKEELAGERNNYIHNRANVLHKDVIEVLEDVVNETLDAYERVTEALRGTKAYSLWMRFVNGYM
uniref:Uncharacterized protein n=1 Tax=Psilocybe cubensis TaxID=181762 RepID=A0A8H7XR02_PSICU